MKEIEKKLIRERQLEKSVRENFMDRLSNEDLQSIRDWKKKVEVVKEWVSFKVYLLIK